MPEGTSTKQRRIQNRAARLRPKQCLPQADSRRHARQGAGFSACDSYHGYFALFSMLCLRYPQVPVYIFGKRDPDFGNRTLGRDDLRVTRGELRRQRVVRRLHFCRAERTGVCYLERDCVGI